MELQTSTGVVEYNLNGKVKVHFNPSDAAFVKKLMGVFETMEQKQKEAKQEINGANDPKRVFEIADAYDAEMRTMLDSIFDVPVCDALFGTMNVYALADDLPVWMNLLLTILDVCAASYDGIDEKMEYRIKKYTAKYKK